MKMSKDQLKRLTQLLPPGRLLDEVMTGRFEALETLTELTKPLVMICPKLPAYLDPLNDELPEEVEHPPPVPTSESNLPHVERLLDWASNLSEQRRVLDEPVKFLEAPLRPVQVERISDYAARQLRTIISARIHTDAGGHGIFTPEWWQDRKDDALAALAALRDALEGSQE